MTRYRYHRTSGTFLVAVTLLSANCGDRPEASTAGSLPSATRPSTAPLPTAAPVLPARSRPRAEPSRRGDPLLEGQDFGNEARLLFRVAACSGREPLPEGIDAAVVKAHCDWLCPRMESYRRIYLGRAMPFLGKLRPAACSTTVVYPFGGGDLLSALTSYPEATEITTLSLEHGGDPRRLRSFDKAHLESALDRLRRAIGQLLTLDDSASESLMRVERGGIPGQLAFFLVGLAVQGQEPVSLRYFRLEANGGVHYLSEAEIAASNRKRASKLSEIWNAPDFSEAFSNLELTFRPAGAPGTPLRVHRHIAANLADGPLTKDPAVLRHLEQKGRVCALVKAASYLLWTDAFRMLRSYLLTNADFMFSDSSGIPPWDAAKAGFVQETYGDFDGAFIPAGRKGTVAFRELWKSQPHRDLGFRFGYADAKKQPHLLVTRRAAPWNEDGARSRPSGEQP